MSLLSTIPAGDTRLTALVAQITSLQAVSNPTSDQLNQIESLQRQLVDSLIGSGKLLPGTVLSTIAYSVSPNDQIGANLVAHISTLNTAITAQSIATSGPGGPGPQFVVNLQAQLAPLQAQLIDVLMSSGRMTAATILNSASLSYVGGYPVYSDN